MVSENSTLEEERGRLLCSSRWPWGSDADDPVGGRTAMIDGPIDLRLSVTSTVCAAVHDNARDSPGTLWKVGGSPELRARPPDLRADAWTWRFPPDAVAACVGTKEFVGSLALLLGPLVASHRDTVLVQRWAYPNLYAVERDLAVGRVVRGADDESILLDLDAGRT